MADQYSLVPKFQPGYSVRYCIQLAPSWPTQSDTYVQYVVIQHQTGNASPYLITVFTALLLGVFHFCAFPLGEVLQGTIPLSSDEENICVFCK